jgi:hypothetical protein
MSNKRRRSSGKRGGGSGSRGGSGATRAGSSARTRSAGTTPARRSSAGRGRTPASRTPRRQARRRATTRERITVPAGTPSPLYSVARGLLTTMASPALVTLSVVSALILWGGLAAIGSPPAPSAMNEALSLPPVHSLFDLFLLSSASGLAGATAAALGAFVALTVFHAAYMTVAISLAQSAHERSSSREALAGAWGRLRSRFAWVLLVELGFVSLSIVVIRVFAPIFGGLGLVAGLLTILYFSVFVEPAVVLQGMPVREALRASFDVARLIGTRNVYLVGGYVLLVIVVSLGPGRPGVVTPTVVVWAYALLAGLLHLSMLSAFVHRWGVLAPVVRPETARQDEQAVPALRP